MAPTSASLSNMTTGQSNTTRNNTEFCRGQWNVEFETLNSSVPYLVNAALNVPLALVATITNLLVLLAMRHVTSLRFPSKLLLYSLVLTDLGAGLVVQPQFTAFLFMKAINPHSFHNCHLIYSFGFTSTLFSDASIFTMAAISLDRYTALFFYLRYEQIVTTRRVCAVLTFIWSYLLFFASSNLWNRVVWTNFLQTNLPIAFLVISVTNIKIYRRLRGQDGQQVQPQVSIQAQQQAESTLYMAKYKQTASTMKWIYVLFLICYLPFLFSSLIILAVAHTALTQCIWEVCYTVVLINSCLNPIVYCLRLPEIQTEVMKQLRQLCRRNAQQ